ncbi:MAG: hypothetical protein WBE86_15990 [Candidatus Acidiferrales bacterium]
MTLKPRHLGQNSIRLPKGLSVTVCIAAKLIEDGKEKLVLVSDSKVAFGQFSADNAIRKDIPLLQRHAVLIAGNNVSRAGIILERARNTLKSVNKPHTDQVAEAVFDSCKTEWDRIADTTVLHKHGYSLATFRKMGKNLCSDAVFYDIHSELKQVSLSLDILVVGFDDKEKAHIRFVNADTPPEDYDSLGFWAIGSGKHEALASLSYAVEHLDCSFVGKLGPFVYHLLAAKFMAESASDVGKTTQLVILDAQTPRLFHDGLDGSISYIRQRWEDGGAPRLPRGVEEDWETFMKIDTKELLTVLDGQAEPSQEIKEAAKLSPQISGILDVASRMKQRKLTQ